MEQNIDKLALMLNIMQKMPNQFWVLSTTTVQERFGIDLVLIGSYTIYLIETKRWNGQIRGDEHNWLLNGRPVDNPLDQINETTKRVKTILVNYDKDFRDIEIKPYVAFAEPMPEVCLDIPNPSNFISVSELVQILEEHRTKHTGKELTARQKIIIEHALGGDRAETMTLRVDVEPITDINHFFNIIQGSIEPFNFVYSTVALLSYSSKINLVRLSHIIESKNLNQVELNDFEQLLRSAHINPLRIESMHYGSPLVVDLLGIGNVLQVVIDLIKDITWRSKHEKLLAENERVKGGLEIEKGKKELEGQDLANEKARLEIMLQEIELVKTLPITSQQRDIILSMMIPKLKVLVDTKDRFTLELKDPTENVAPQSSISSSHPASSSARPNPQSSIQ